MNPLLKLAEMWRLEAAMLTCILLLKNRHEPHPCIPVEFDYATFPVRESHVALPSDPR